MSRTRAGATEGALAGLEVEVVEVATPQGVGRLHVSASPAPKALLLLGHGAGGGLDGVDLVALATALPARGITVVRHEQPWKVAGRRVAVRPPLLDEAWLPAVAAARELAPQVPVVVGGHSAGARVACRTATQTGAAGALALSFPLHPPGRPEKSRAHELLGAGVPVRVVQGDKDAFGTDAEVAAVIDGRPDISLVGVPFAGHDLRLAARAASAAGTSTAQWWGEQVDALGDWVLAPE